MPGSKSSLLLECIRELKQLEIRAVAADDLDADGKPIGSKTCRNGYRRPKGRRDPIRRLHPRDVVFHLHAIDGRGPVQRGIEWGDLIHGAKQEFILLLKSSHPVEQ